ncbi:MAG: leucyl/phenylalanyl-tRNA--protein transferase [Mucilaginibacter polytrichastri]|nr:leucyl/phenylalanyl-tRNA--protein transferase [Mucilaginibacter polytrichastri]
MIFRLTDALVFPDPALAEDDGLLAIGGDLSSERLELAYCSGIFPWFSEDDLILWYSPDPRFVLYPQEIKVSKSMRKVLSQSLFHYTKNEAFDAVIEACAETERPGQSGTWITEGMKAAYKKLHRKGLAHSYEVWQNGVLSGGFYGVKTGDIFCGESMFSRVPNASKAALIELCRNESYPLIDCQVHTDHLESMGARFISRTAYLDHLNP